VAGIFTQMGRFRIGGSCCSLFASKDSTRPEWTRPSESGVGSEVGGFRPDVRWSGVENRWDSEKSQTALLGGPLFIGAAREIKHLPLASIRDGTGD
jgi:hypothetical protein